MCDERFENAPTFIQRTRHSKVMSISLVPTLQRDHLFRQVASML